MSCFLFKIYNELLKKMNIFKMYNLFLYEEFWNVLMKFIIY